MKQLVTTLFTILLVSLLFSPLPAVIGGDDDLRLFQLPLYSGSSTYPAASGRSPKAIDYVKSSGAKGRAIVYCTGTQTSRYFATDLRCVLIESDVQVADFQITDIENELDLFLGANDGYSIPWLDMFDVFYTSNGTPHVAMSIGQCDYPDQMMFSVFRLYPDDSNGDYWKRVVALYDHNIKSGTSDHETRDLTGSPTFRICMNPKLDISGSPYGFTAVLRAVKDWDDTQQDYWFRFDWEGDGSLNQVISLETATLSEYPRSPWSYSPYDFDVYYDNSSTSSSNHTVRFVRNETYDVSGVTKYRLVVSDIEAGVSSLQNTTTIVSGQDSLIPVYGAGSPADGTIAGKSTILYKTIVSNDDVFSAWDVNSQGSAVELDFGPDTTIQEGNFEKTRFAYLEDGRPFIVNNDGSKLQTLTPDHLNAFGVYWNSTDSKLGVGSVRFCEWGYQYNPVNLNYNEFNTIANYPMKAVWSSEPVRHPTTGDTIYTMVLQRTDGGSPDNFYALAQSIRGNQGTNTHSISGTLSVPASTAFHIATVTDTTGWSVTPYKQYMAVFEIDPTDMGNLRDDDYLQFSVLDKTYDRVLRDEVISGQCFKDMTGGTYNMAFMAPVGFNTLYASTALFVQSSSTSARSIDVSSISICESTDTDGDAATNIENTDFTSIVPANSPWVLDTTPTYYEASSTRTAITSSHPQGQPIYLGIAHNGEIGLEQDFTSLSSGLYRVSVVTQLVSAVGDGGNSAPAFNLMVLNPTGTAWSREIQKSLKTPMSAVGSKQTHTFHVNVPFTQGDTRFRLTMQDFQTPYDNIVKWTMRVHEIRIDRIETPNWGTCSDGLPNDTVTVEQLSCGDTKTGQLTRANSPAGHLLGSCTNEEADVWYGISVPDTGTVLRTSFTNASNWNSVSYYSGACVCSPTYISCDSGTGTTTLDLTTTEDDQQVWIRVEGDYTSSQTLNVQCIGLGPDNDECTGALPIYGGTPVTGTLTQYAGNSSPSWCVTMSDVWYYIDIPSSGTQVDATFSHGSTAGAVGVYSGTCGSLTSRDCESTTSSSVTATYTTTTSNERVWIRIGATYSASQTLTVNCTQTVSNNEYSNATLISCGYSVLGCITNGATLSTTPVANPCSLTGVNDVWYRYQTLAGYPDVVDNDTWGPEVTITFDDEPYYGIAHGAGDSNLGFIALYRLSGGNLQLIDYRCGRYDHEFSMTVKLGPIQNYYIRIGSDSPSPSKTFSMDCNSKLP